MQGALRDERFTTPHLLTLEDPQMPAIRTDAGEVTFVQVLLVRQDEVQAASSWRASSVMEMLRAWPASEGGPGLLCVSDSTRTQSIFDVRPDAMATVQRGVREEGAALGVVSAAVDWTHEGDNV